MHQLKTLEDVIEYYNPKQIDIPIDWPNVVELICEDEDEGDFIIVLIKKDGQWRHPEISCDMATATGMYDRL